MSDDEFGFETGFVFRSPKGETQPVRFLRFKDKETPQELNMPIDANGKVIENAQKDTTKLATHDEPMKLTWYNEIGTERERRAKD